MTPAAFDVLCTAVTASVAGAGAAVLLRPALRRTDPRTLGAWHAVGAGVIVLGLTAALCPFLNLAGAGVRFFGWLRLIYLAGVVAIPLVALVLLALRGAGRVRTTRPAIVVACLGALGAPLGLWMSFVEPGRLVVERPVFHPPAARAGTSEVRIGVLADLQTDCVGAHEHDAVDTLMREKPDVIVIAGDLIQATEDEFERELPAMRALLAKLDAPLGVFFVQGDVDTPHGATQLLEGTKVRELRDEVVRIAAGDRALTIGGIATRLRSISDVSGAARVMQQLEYAPGTDDIRILLTHAPDAALLLPQRARTDLVVAGHTHGGQVQVPGWGAPFTLSNVSREVGSGGLHAVRGTTVYVSRGVGMERLQAPRIRLFCVPEVAVLTIPAGREAATR